MTGARHRTSGRFIAFEGGEGAGKSTQARLLADALRARGLTVIVTREPGGTARAEAIRSLLLAPPGEGWPPQAEALLFAAARADHVAHLIRPALARGDWVICDRFVDSSRAYQGGAGGLGDTAITALHAFGSDGLRWHTRAFCHIDRKFKDFILSRCMGARLPDAAGASASDDPFWGKSFSVVLCPNPRLTADQQKVIAGDFAMENGEVAVPVRRALLYYFSKRLRLDVADRFDDPSEAPVVVKNRDDFDVALLEATR